MSLVAGWRTHAPSDGPSPAPTCYLQIRKGGKKAALLTTSGQDVPVYQYNLGAGSAVVHTIKQVLIPGNLVLTADAAAPSPV